MIDLSQFKSLIVTPALTAVGLGGTTAISLVTGTAYVESGLVYLKQLETGPALGLFQMEPETHDYLWTLPKMSYGKGVLGERVLDSIEPLASSSLGAPKAAVMVWNLYYAAIMCRIKYLSVSEPLPACTASLLADYWKRIYNTDLGAGEVDEVHVAKFQEAIEA